MKYTKIYSTKITPQSRAIPGRKMAQNEAGGFAFPLDKWARLNRFLILGTEGGAFYVGEQKLTLDNAQNVLECINEQGRKVVNEIEKVSGEGRAIKNDAAIFALAMCAKMGDEPTRAAAYDAVSRVVRTGTHLFQFAAACDDLGGWGRGMKRAVARYYTGRDVNHLAYEMAKYQQREGWSNADLLRLSHPKAPSGAHTMLYKWALGKLPAAAEIEEMPEIIKALEAVKANPTPEFAALTIGEFGLTREMIPTSLLPHPDVQRALLAKMPLIALIRNLGNLSKSGVLSVKEPATVSGVCARLTDREYIRKSRVHPISILTAMKTYEAGQGVRGSGKWDPVGKVVDALNDAFYLAFDNVQSTGKTVCVAVDASGSMDSPIPGSVNLSSRMAGVALALVVASTEDVSVTLGFTCDGKVRSIPITPRQRLTDAMNTFDKFIIPEGTDCALPFIWALDEKMPVDLFVIITDNQTWAGHIHPCQALQEYRNKMQKHDAKAIVLATQAYDTTIADTDDAGYLDIAGFDPSVPTIIRAFALGEL